MRKEEKERKKSGHALGDRKSFFVLCFCTYATAYLCRLNLSIALEKIGNGVGIGTSGVLTVFGTSFFGVYGIFQLVNGFVGDRINPVRFVTVAVCGITISNFLISAMQYVYPMLVLWCANAVFQAMLWGPMMRMLSMEFPPGAKNKLTLGMTFSQIAGYVLAWGGLNNLLLESSWRYYFLLPACAALVCACAWIAVCASGKRFAREEPAEGRKILVHTTCLEGLRRSLRVMKRDGLATVALLCILCGIVKESFSMWAPGIFLLLGMNTEDSWSYLMIFPFGQALGAFFAAYLIKKAKNKIKTPLQVECGIMLICCVPLLILQMPVACMVFLMVMVSSMANAEGNTFFGYIPLSYSREGMVSTLSGTFDFCSYVGSAISSLILASAFSGESIFLLAAVWCGIAAASFCLASLIRIGRDRGKSQEKVK